MSTLLTFDDTIEKIVGAVEKLNSQERRALLAQVNATVLLKKGVPKIGNPAKSLKPLTMTQIDGIKHKVRK
jgi:Mg2+/Co2+ transporter CorC